jgi:indole-3-glycerol phosphate synthase
VGVNARDLASLEVSGDRFAQLRTALDGPGLDGALTVAESGVRGPDDAAAVAGTYDAVLVGEAVATAVDPAAAVRALVEAGAAAPARVGR